MDPTNTTAPVAAAAALEMTPELAFAYTGMILMALVPIYIGSHLSLNRKKTARTTNLIRFDFSVKPFFHQT
jgi:hypothetical protein